MQAFTGLQALMQRVQGTRTISSSVCGPQRCGRRVGHQGCPTEL